MGMVRLGAVSYLNVRPLVYGLAEHPGIRLRFDVPSVCARLLDAGDIDLGMVPSIAYLDRPGDRIVPGVCIGSDGAVASVALFTRKPVREVSRIALDTSSRTSAALVRILASRRFEIDPVFVPAAPDLAAMLAAADAALVIGDLALFADHRALGAEKIDLGEAWSAMTGLPFVWAFWSGRADAADTETVGLLQRAAEAGMANTAAIAADYCRATPERIPLAERYLREHLAFRLTPRAIKGLSAYYAEASRLGLARAAAPAFFEPGHSAIMERDVSQPDR